MTLIKDTTQTKANEARSLFKKGNIFDPSIDELTEYVQALLSTTYHNGEDKEYANTLKDVIAIKRAENLHEKTLILTEKLHTRTSILTWIVISLTIINIVIGAFHMKLLYNKSVLEEMIQKKQVEINQLQLNKLNEPNKQEAFIPP